MATNFYSTIKPILYISLLLGLISFKFDSSGLKPSKYSKYLKIIVVVGYAALAGISMVWRAQMNSDLSTTTDIMKTTTSTVQLIVIWICSMVYQNKYIIFLQKIVEVDKKFQQLGVWIYYDNLKQSLRKRMGSHLILVIISIITNALTSAEPMSLEMTGYTIARFLPFIINFAIVQQITTYILLIKERFKTINEHLINLQSQNALVKHEIQTIKLTSPLGTKLTVLRVTCALHHELTKTAKIINKVFGITLLVTFAVCFVTTTVGLYYLSVFLQNFQSNRVELVLAPISSCSSYIFDTLYLCYSCQTTVEEVSILVNH